jgi:hypothetical protein
MALAAINKARRALERLGGMPLSLPAYATLTPVEQLFVAVNLERTERGLAPVVVLSKSLTAVAQAGARAGRDPAMKACRSACLAAATSSTRAPTGLEAGSTRSAPTTRGCTTTGLAETTWTAERAPHGCAGGTGTTS